MLDERKVRLMTELALYEQNQGKEDFKINEYYRNDYTGFHTICSVIWVTIGYVCAVGLAVFAAMDFLLVNISKTLVITLGLGIAGGYAAVLIIYTLISQVIFRNKHREARERVKKFNYNLTKLLKMYEKEKQ